MFHSSGGHSWCLPSPVEPLVSSEASGSQTGAQPQHSPACHAVGPLSQYLLKEWVVSTQQTHEPLELVHASHDLDRKRSNKRIWMDWDSNGQTSDWIERPQNEQGTFGAEAVDCSLFVQHHKCLPKKKKAKNHTTGIICSDKTIFIMSLSWRKFSGTIGWGMACHIMTAASDWRVTFWSQRYFLSSLHCHFGSQ